MTEFWTEMELPEGWKFWENDAGQNMFPVYGEDGLLVGRVAVGLTGPDGHTVGIVCGSVEELRSLVNEVIYEGKRA